MSKSIEELVKCDYTDFQKFTQEEIFPFLADVQRFLTEIEKII